MLQSQFFSMPTAFAKGLYYLRRLNGPREFVEGTLADGVGEIPNSTLEVQGTEKCCPPPFRVERGGSFRSSEHRAIEGWAGVRRQASDARSMKSRISLIFSS